MGEEAKKKPSVDTSKAEDKAGDVVTDFVAEKEESPLATPSPLSGGGELSSVGLVGEDGPSVKLDSRVKLDHLRRYPSLQDHCHQQHHVFLSPLRLRRLH